MHDGKSAQEFSASYTLENDEYFKISNFILPDAILDAIRSPLGIQIYSKQTYDSNGSVVELDEPGDDVGSYSDFPDIRAVFMGERIEQDYSERFNIAFQKLRREQHLTQNHFNMFFDKDTFHVEKKVRNRHIRFCRLLFQWRRARI